MEKIIKRIMSKIGGQDFLQRIDSLNGPDFNSMLLQLFSLRVEKFSPQKVLHHLNENRFTRPSNINPVRQHQLELELLLLCEEFGIKPKLISPVAPLGSCSVFGCVNQNNVLSAVRNVEILSDPTNVLAMMLAGDLLAGQIQRSSCTHYAATAQVVRGQHFKNPNSKAYFGIFCIVSTTKDKGSYLSEQELILKQLEFYQQLLETRYKSKMGIVLKRRRGYKDYEGFFENMRSLIHNHFPDTEIATDLSSENNQYYEGINFKIYIRQEGRRKEVADGGFVDWIRKMTGNQKDRCLISGLGLERILLKRSENEKIK